MAKQPSRIAMPRVWKAVENPCLRITIVQLSPSATARYRHVDNRTEVRQNACFLQSVEVATSGSDHGVQQALEIIRAVEADAYDSAITALELYLDVSLESFTKLVLNALYCRAAASMLAGFLRSI